MVTTQETTVLPDTPDDVVLTIPVQDGQYHLHAHSSAGEPSWPDTIDGLLVGDDTWLAVLTGTHWGPVTARLRPHDARPATVEPGRDMVTEWTLNIPDNEITLQATYGGGGTTITIPGDWARLRVSVRNRRAARSVVNKVKPF